MLYYTLSYEQNMEYLPPEYYGSISKYIRNDKLYTIHSISKYLIKLMAHQYIKFNGNVNFDDIGKVRCYKKLRKIFRIKKYENSGGILNVLLFLAVLIVNNTTKKRLNEIPDKTIKLIIDDETFIFDMMKNSTISLLGNSMFGFGGKKITVNTSDLKINKNIDHVIISVKIKQILLKKFFTANQFKTIEFVNTNNMELSTVALAKLITDNTQILIFRNVNINHNDNSTKLSDYPNWLKKVMINGNIVD